MPLELPYVDEARQNMRDSELTSYSWRGSGGSSVWQKREDNKIKNSWDVQFECMLLTEYTIFGFQKHMFSSTLMLLGLWYLDAQRQWQ